MQISQELMRAIAEELALEVRVKDRTIAVLEDNVASLRANVDALRAAAVAPDPVTDLPEWGTGLLREKMAADGLRNT
jgi:hypothetical protein